MGTSIRIKKSAVSSRAPGTSDIDYGELALNYADGKLYYKTSSNAIEHFASSSTGDITLLTPTAGTVVASKAVIVDSNKDIASFRNVTLTGELDAGSLDVSGDVDIDGTLETDALSINGTSVSSTAAELNLLDGSTANTVVNSKAVIYGSGGQVAVTSLSGALADGVTATTQSASDNSTKVATTAYVDNAAAGNLSEILAAGNTTGSTNLVVTDGQSITTNTIAETTSGSGVTIDGVLIKDNAITASGEIDGGSLDISGDADIDGTLEADAITVNGTALATVIAGTTVTNATNATNATNSSHVLVTDNESTAEENLITFVEGATSSTGNVGLEMDGNLTYNPSTGTLTSTIFKGNIDAVDGDFDGTLEADAITIGGTSISSIFSPIAGGGDIVTTGALNSGSITSGFGSINNGSSAITTTGTGSFGTVSISGTSTGDALLITTTEASSTAAPVITLKRNSGSPADADYLGQLKFKGENDADQEVNYAKITAKISDASDGSEDGLIEYMLKGGGSNVIAARLSSTDLKLINGVGLEVAGNTTLGDASGDSVTINAATIALANVAAGTDNTVLVYNGSTVLTDEIDSRVWGSTLVDGSGTANYITKWSDSNTVTDSVITDDGSTVTIGGNLTVNGTTTTLNATNSVVTDNLFELNSGVTSNANDSGIIIERGSTGNNALFIWDESADKFAVGTTTATADSTGNISYTAAGLITGALTVDDISIDGSTISDAGDLTLDVAGDIILDADGGDIVLKDGGSQFGLLSNDNFTLKIQNHAQDTDISIIGNDGGSLVTALFLDMSEAGAATFNDKVIATELDISGDVDIDGTTNLDVVDIDGAVDMASTLTVAGEITANGGIALGDNDKSTFGAGDDLQIYHDGSHARLREITGDFRVQTTSSGVNALVAKQNAEIELYHAGSVKLATTSTGIDVTGNVSLADNGKSTFGAGDDLQIYHTGTESWIKDAGSGNLYIDSNGAAIQLTSGGAAKSMINAIPDGGVTIFHNNSSKLNTTSSGITVTGNVGMTTGNTTGKFAVGISAVHGSFDFYNQGTAYFNGATTVDDNLTVNGNIAAGSGNITTTGVGTFASLDISGNIDVDGTTNLDVVDIDGAVDMASTLAVGTRVGIGVAAHASAALNITTTNQHIRFNNGSELGVISLDSDGKLDLWAHGDGESIDFRTGTGSGTVAMSVVGTNVGIGTTSPASPLSVHADAIGIRLDGTSNTTRSIFYRNTTASNPAQIIADGSLRLFTEDSGTDIRFHVNSNGSSNEKMRINATGVGIGTISPSSPLSVNKDTGTTSAYSTASVARIEGGYNLNEIGGIGFGYAGSDATSKKPHAFIGSVIEQWTNYSKGGLVFATRGVDTDTEPTESVRIDSSGNVGIGTSSPSKLLHVVDGAGTVPTLGAGTEVVIQNNDNTGDNCRLNILAGAAASSLLEFGDASDADVGQIEYSHSSNQMNFRVNGGTKMSITSAGNITVSGTVDGRDLATDGTKLDTIETSATADQTASEILTAIKTVDGSGSGLDADLLDGAQPSVSAGNNTIVKRHSSGYIFANYFNTTPNDVTSGVTQVCVETGNDGYIRHGSAAAIRTFIGVESGATADQSASEILTAIKTVDGSGSGLDADTLDGLELHTGRNNEANKVVRTQGNGYLNVGWINTTSGARTTQAITRVYASDDSYLRYYSLANFGSQISSHIDGGNADTLDGQHGSYYRDASNLNAGTIPSARIAHNTFDIGDTTAETGRSVHETGIYTFNVNNNNLGSGTASAYYSVLGFGQGTGGMAQIAAKWTSSGDKLYYRSLRDTTDNWWDWREIWHSGNDGSGSGLDADTLDGIQGSSLLRSDTSDSVAKENIISFNCYDAIESSSGDQSSLQVFQDTSGSDAFMTFHISGDYAAYFGLDGSTNDFSVGGFSMGNNKYKVWHAGNDGSGSGLDADTVDGIQGSSFLRSDANDSASGSIDFTGDVDFTNYLRTDEIRAYGGQDLSITAGESYTHLTKGSNNDEIIRLAGEGGVIVYASSDNLSSGLNKATTLINTSGDMNISRRLYIGNSSSYFFTDSGTRTAFTGGDFYIQSGVTNYYNYATYQYLGSSSGDNIYLRGNTISGNSWSLTENGGLRANISDGSHSSGGTSYFPGYHNRTYGHEFEATSTGTTLHLSRQGGGCMQIGSDANATLVAIRNTNSASTGVATQVGFISITSSSTTFGTSSDYRLKENEVSITDGITRIKQLSPLRFNFIVEPEKTVDGFLAHEVSSIVPEAIVGEKDAMKDEEYEISPATYDEKGEVVEERVMGTRSVPDYQGIDQSKLVPLLTAALQEAITKIEENTAEIATLKTQVAALTSNSPE